MARLLLLTIALLFLNQVLTSTIEDAEIALEEFQNLTLLYQGELHLHMNAQSTVLRNRVESMRNTTLQQISDQIADISSKISTLVENTENITDQNVETCLGSAQKDLDNFAAEMTERTGECGGHMIETGNFMVYSTWSKVWKEYDIHYGCSDISLKQCRDYENTEECADAVLANIQASKDKIAEIFEILKVDMVNNIEGLSFPCNGMIAQELALYPSLILNFVSTCLELASVRTFELTC